jgi:heme A synthase
METELVNAFIEMGQRLAAAGVLLAVISVVGLFLRARAEARREI